MVSYDIFQALCVRLCQTEFKWYKTAQLYDLLNDPVDGSLQPLLGNL